MVGQLLGLKINYEQINHEPLDNFTITGQDMFC
jgi:hypothetical protein